MLCSQETHHLLAWGCTSRRPDACKYIMYCNSGHLLRNISSPCMRDVIISSEMISQIRFRPPAARGLMGRAAASHLALAPLVSRPSGWGDCCSDVSPATDCVAHPQVSSHSCCWRGASESLRLAWRSRDRAVSMSCIDSQVSTSRRPGSRMQIHLQKWREEKLHGAAAQTNGTVRAQSLSVKWLPSSNLVQEDMRKRVTRLPGVLRKLFSFDKIIL